MNDLAEVPMIASSTNELNELPVIFINRDGDPEPGSLSAALTMEETGDLPTFVLTNEANVSLRAAPMTLPTALNRLRRALFETGQLIVTTEDGLVRVCFAGIGDPERLFIEAVPRDVPVPAMDGGFPGCLCGLPQAEAILANIYRGETSRRIESALRSLARGGLGRPRPERSRVHAAA